MIKIAICGKANSGKNTVSKMITKEIRERKRSYQSVSYIAFADPIKEMVRLMFPALPKKFLYSSSKYRSEIIPGAFKDGQPLTIRQALIDLGTGVGRQYKETVWLDAFDEECKNHNYTDILIVPDLRFKNEFDHLKNKNFYIIKLYRDNNSTIINHASETSQDQIPDSDFDYILPNNGTMQDLKLLVTDVVNNLNI
jgi:hypothetical protein